ncbi:Short-chain dehydrogenase/reductase tropE [Lachnellula arida]|uniref:Short-chain dehydrogenase/reductase tropE n=1 Tax=Lachnellula arida TaxID=1316785 RepID=A0A8T9B4Y7_9HELO|nr:Short-chain dehydrogenase/reductase tropE [Lachnellula arida]
MAYRKVVLVTGGNNGIGYEAVKAFLQSQKPYHILLGSRSVEKGQLALDALRQEVPGSKNTVEVLQVDLESDDSIEQAFEQVKKSPGQLDALVNNAGASFDPAFISGKISLRDCFNKAYNVNVSDTNVMSWTFMPLLLKSPDPRLLFIAGLSQITLAAEKYFPTPPQPAGWPKTIDFETIGYRCSKTALNMLMLDWNHKLKEDGVKVFGVGPGFLATNLGNDPELAVKAKAMGAKHPSLGGLLIRSVVGGERDADVGKLVNKDGLSAF